MYFAMNRFKIAIGHEDAFENVWKGRDSSLAEVPGFKEFRLLRGETVADEGYTLLYRVRSGKTGTPLLPGRSRRIFAPRTKTLPKTARCISGRRNSRGFLPSKALDRGLSGGERRIKYPRA
jgi:hypothetical protein